MCASCCECDVVCALRGELVDDARDLPVEVSGHGNALMPAVLCRNDDERRNCRDRARKGCRLCADRDRPVPAGRMAVLHHALHLFGVVCSCLDDGRLPAKPALGDHCLGDLRIESVSQWSDEKVCGAGGSSPEITSCRIGLITQCLDGFLHLCPRLRPNVRMVVDDVGDRRPGHAGECGDGLDRWSVLSGACGGIAHSDIVEQCGRDRNDFGMVQSMRVHVDGVGGLEIRSCREFDTEAAMCTCCGWRPRRPPDDLERREMRSRARDRAAGRLQTAALAICGRE